MGVRSVAQNVKLSIEPVWGPRGRRHVERFFLAYVSSRFASVRADDVLFAEAAGYNSAPYISASLTLSGDRFQIHTAVLERSLLFPACAITGSSLVI